MHFAPQICATIAMSTGRTRATLGADRSHQIADRSHPIAVRSHQIVDSDIFIQWQIQNLDSINSSKGIFIRLNINGFTQKIYTFSLDLRAKFIWMTSFSLYWLHRIQKKKNRLMKRIFENIFLENEWKSNSSI